VYVGSNGKLDIDESGEEDDNNDLSANSIMSNITGIFTAKNKFAALKEKLWKVKEYIVGEQEAFNHTDIKDGSDSDSSSDEDNRKGTSITFYEQSDAYKLKQLYKAMNILVQIAKEGLDEPKIQGEDLDVKEEPAKVTPKILNEEARLGEVQEEITTTRKDSKPLHHPEEPKYILKAPYNFWLIKTLEYANFFTCFLFTS
jgi:hypothetical protein